MPKIEKKIIKNKPFFYLSEQVNIGKKYKKISVYLGKHIPNDITGPYRALAKKEQVVVSAHLATLFTVDRVFTLEMFQKLEEARIAWKYFLAVLTPVALERQWRLFAIQFIFESNAIEGSKLSQAEVTNIVTKKYVKKTTPRKEIQEVRNAIAAFDHIRGGGFRLNQRSIIALHTLVTNGLDIAPGYKTHAIVVHNKETTPPGQIRGSMAHLLAQYQKERRSKRHPLAIAADFHARFEHIHPFEDGNGRVGRLLFIWMLFREGYPPVLFRYKNRSSYFTALDQADEGRPKKWYWYCVRVYTQTVRGLIDTSLKSIR